MILVDAGPMVALLSRDDQQHASCVEALARMREPLATVWPAVTEAVYLLGPSLVAQEALLDRIEAGAPRVLTLDELDVHRIKELMRKYRDRPMDLADAALVRVAEREGLTKIFTVDRGDFEVYRLHGRRRFEIWP